MLCQHITNYSNSTLILILWSSPSVPMVSTNAVRQFLFCFKHAVNCKIGVFLHLGLYDLRYQENPLYGHRAHTAVPVRTQPPSTCCSNILFVSISKLAFQRGACFRLCLEATSKAHYQINYYYMNSESCKATLVQSNNKQLR